nr:hypothetical protein [Tanacetum cinerariifolium]
MLRLYCQHEELILLRKHQSKHTRYLKRIFRELVELENRHQSQRLQSRSGNGTFLLLETSLASRLDEKLIGPSAKAKHSSILEKSHGMRNLPGPQAFLSQLVVEESRLAELELGNPGIDKPVLDKLEAGFDHD